MQHPPPPRVPSLDADLAVALESEGVDEMQQFGRQKRHREVEDPVAEGHGRHQPLHGRHGDAVAAVVKCVLSN